MNTYKFNLKTGHYYLVEGENNTQETEAKETENSANTPVLKNLNTEEIVQMQQDKQGKLEQAQKTIDSKKNIVIQAQNKIALLENSDNVSQDSLNQLLKQLLQALMDLEAAKFEKAKIENEENKKILQALQALVESSIIKRQIPEKYKCLNESNIQNAKIHVDKLIRDDALQRIQGMVDFKKAFSNSELLYGKDKDGYYAVCIDQQDFTKLTNTLEEVGFMREDILSCCLPQIFDRSDMVK